MNRLSAFCCRPSFCWARFWGVLKVPLRVLRAMLLADECLLQLQLTEFAPILCERPRLRFLAGLQLCKRRAHTNGGVQQRTLLRRVLRRVLVTAFEKVLRRVLRRCLAVGFNGKEGSEKVLRRGSEKVLRRGSKKGLSRRHLEGRNTPFQEYDPVGVCHNLAAIVLWQWGFSRDNVRGLSMPQEQVFLRPQQLPPPKTILLKLKHAVPVQGETMLGVPQLNYLVQWNWPI